MKLDIVQKYPLLWHCCYQN